jgi:hypothetical protein
VASSVGTGASAAPRGGVVTGWQAVAYRALAGPCGPAQYKLFQNLNYVQNSKFKFSAMLTSKNGQTLHGAIFGHGEEYFPLAQLQIPIGSHVIILEVFPI